MDAWWHFKQSYQLVDADELAEIDRWETQGRFMNLELLACYSVHLLCIIHHLRCLGNNYRSRAGDSMHASKSQHVL